LERVERQSAPRAGGSVGAREPAAEGPRAQLIQIVEQMPEKLYYCDNGPKFLFSVTEGS
jgi:hypothetical protein